MFGHSVVQSSIDDHFPDDIRDCRRISAECDVGGQDGLALLAVVVRRDGKTLDRRHRLLQGRAEPPGIRRDQGAKVFWWKKGSEVEFMLILAHILLSIKVLNWLKRKRHDVVFVH